MFDRRRKTYTTYYNTGCCFISPPRLNPTTLSGAVGGSGLETLQLKNACTSAWESALDPFYWSDNTGIATIGSSSGSADLVGVGDTSLWGRARYFKDRPWECLFVLAAAAALATVNNPPQLGSFRINVTSTPVSGETNSVVSGQSAQAKVEALTTSGAVFTGYRGTVQFSSTDTLATLPGNYTYTAADNGGHTFNVTLRTVAGNSPTRPLTVRDISTSITTTKNIFLWFNPIATRLGLVGNTTACGHVIVANDRFVALPATGLCNVGVRLARGLFKVNTIVLDVGPWCPNTPVPGGFNQCSCSSNRYWQTTGVPAVESMTCDTNNAGIDLADGTFADLGLTSNARIFWRFQ